MIVVVVTSHFDCSGWGMVNTATPVAVIVEK